MSILADFISGQQAGQQQRTFQQGQSKLAQLEALAPQVVAGDAGAYAKAAALDPKAAQGYQAAGDAQLKRLGGFIDYVEGARKTGNPAAVNAALAQGANFIQQLTGKPAPTEWTADMEPGWEALKAQVAMARAGQSGAIPTDVRSFEAMTAGLSPDDRERARRINLGLDGRASSSGFSQVKFTGADGRERIGVLNGKTGQIDLPDGTSFNPQTGAISQTQGEQPAAPQSGGQHFGAFTSLAGEFPGVAMTSGVRTAERNQQVGGAANSQHLTGTAADYSVPPQLKPAFIARAKQLGYQAIDEGDHIHLQLPRGGGGAGGPGVFVGRSPEEQAALTEQAKADVQLRNLPAELNARTDAAIRQARGTEMAKTEAEREAQAPKRIKQYEQAIGAAGSVMTSLDNAIKLIGPTTTGWGGARLRSIEGTDAYNLAAEIETIKANLGFDRLQQMRDNSPTGGALGAIAVQELVALQSTIANLDPNQSDEQIKQNLERVKKHYEGWVSAVQQALVDERRGPQAAGAAPAGGQRTILRTGTSNGRKVIQYSDGSVEYGN